MKRFAAPAIGLAGEVFETCGNPVVDYRQNAGMSFVFVALVFPVGTIPPGGVPGGLTVRALQDDHGEKTAG